MQMFTLILTLALQSTMTGFTPDQLWQNWPDERFVQTPAPCLRPADLTPELQKLADLYPDTIELEEIGRSVQGRPIHMVTLGHGPRTVLLWSQMHGDEPSATPALLDIADFLLSRADEPEAAAILDDLTLLMIPMLNPDGSEIYERRNQQAIDINRDALLLTTPEGQILKRIRDEYEPMLGFNLHDQDRRMAVGDTGVLATNSVLAVSGDAEGTVTPGRARAKRACSAIAVTLARFMPGGVARFNEDWNPRAFGDNITAWGTPVVLIESGGLPPGRDLEDLTRLNFVAILTVLQELARNDLEDYDPEVYENLLRNQRDAWADVVVLGGSIQQPRGTSSYRADLAFNIEVDDRDCGGMRHRKRPAFVHRRRRRRGVPGCRPGRRREWIAAGRAVRGRGRGLEGPPVAERRGARGGGAARCRYGVLEGLSSENRCREDPRRWTCGCGSGPA